MSFYKPGVTISVHWDLWRHLFRGELYTESVSTGVRRPIRTRGLTLHLRGSRKDLYIPCTMTSNNREWDQRWFYLLNDDGRLPAYTGKVLTEKLDAWGYGVSPLERQARLKVYTNAFQRLAGKGLTVAIIIANFHRRRVLPLMERKLPRFQMTGDAPFEGTRMVEEFLSDGVSAQRVGRAVSQPPSDLADYWRVSMRPDAGYIQVVSFVSRLRR